MDKWFSSSRTNETSLIDFDESAPSTRSNQPANDLAGLFDSPSPTPVASSNVRDSVMAKFQPSPPAQAMPQFSFAAGSLVSTSPPPQQFGAIMLPGTPKPQAQSTFPQNGGSSTYQPSYQQPLQSSNNSAIPGWGVTPINPSTPSSQTNAAPQAQGKDPFADLAGLF